MIALQEASLMSNNITDIKYNMNIVLKNSFLLYSMIMDILDFSQIKSGNLRL